MVSMPRRFRLASQASITYCGRPSMAPPGDGAPDQFFVLAIAVDVRGIQEIHADVGRAPQRGDGLLLATRKIESRQDHAAKADRGDLERPQFAFLHARLPLHRPS